MDTYNFYQISELALQATGTDFALSKKTVEDAVNLFAANRDVTPLVQVFKLYLSAADRNVGAKRPFDTAIYGPYHYSAL
jgi:hypothetical protein